MDFSDSDTEARFRKDARAFLDANATPKQSAKPRQESEADFIARAKAWQKLKQENGWACLNWPKEFGGRGATPMEMIIWGQEEARYDVPVQPFAIGLGMCGPTVIAFAGAEQKQRYLPRMAAGDEIWCQLFSEPAGGSDVANLRTRAVKDGDEWVVNGQKIWTSGAHYCDYGILLVRTDPAVPKHKGLTMFIVDMKAPGVEIRPIKQASGHSGFNEVYFTDVRIRDDHRLGEVGDGWKVSIVTLMNERLAVGSAGGPDAGEMLQLAQRLELDDAPAIRHQAVREKIADWYCEQSGLKFTKLRVQSALSRGATPGPENSITKIVSANKLQEIGSFGMDLMDMGGILVDEQPMEGQFQGAWMSAPGLRIAGGTDEILRNIIAERVLGMPGDIRVDKNVPFTEVPQGGGKR
ncbi:MAG: acyl-CoA dehydrogenase family protein [Pseudomonadales bacterium]|jgi:alkylation response protein AidB-like acyl-CoA dehydrogenase|nr:acyl-CoA dehydrogenase family protein [Pseudomonadales bacterium]